MTRRRLGRVPWWGWALIGWGAAAGAAAPFIGRRLRHQQPAPPGRPPGDGPPYPHLPERVEPSLAGAILALAYSADVTSARYWLAVCARRGADWSLQRDLWETWQREHTPTRLHTDNDQEHP